MRLPEDETLLNVYRKRRGLTHRELGKILGVSEAAAQRYCLPAGADGHRRPSRSVSARLKVWSGGEITIANYADPWLSPEMAAQIAVAVP